MENDFICIKCEKHFTMEEIRGSIKHPYCKGCFKEDFIDIEDYLKFLRTGRIR